MNYVPTSGHDGFIPENIFYRLAMKAKNEVAESFQAKVADEIIPSIRKHGMYATPQTIDNIINDPDFGIRLLTELKNEREKNSALTERNTVLEQQIEQDKPFTDFGLAISTSEGSITIKQMAALLCQRGMRTGEKRLFEELRQDGFLLTTGGYYNEPAQRWMEQKLFEVRTSSYTNKYGNEQITRQTLITAKGIEYLMNYYLRKHGLMELLTVHRRQVTRQRGQERERVYQSNCTIDSQGTSCDSGV